jgi:exonuclease SbcC
MTPWLQSIVLSNYRSIRGTLTIPLDASVVLIHGQNAAGKTSILSALELALTGKLNALSRAEPEYESHLLHRGATAGSVKLSTTQLGDDDLASAADLTIAVSGSSGTPLLLGDMRAHFTERCYLAQQSLGRLLDMYQHADSSGGSPLTLFVRDLLRLDQLDALIDGLHATGDIRRVRRLVPEFGNVEKLVAQLEAQTERSAQELREVDAILSDLDGTMVAALQSLGRATTIDPKLMAAFLEDDPEEHLLREIARHRRDVRALSEQAIASDASPDAETSRAMESTVHNLQNALEAWDRGFATDLERAFSRAIALNAGVTVRGTAWSLTSLQHLLELIEKDKGQNEEILRADDACLLQGKDLAEAIAKAEVQLQSLEETLATLAADVSDLSQLLAAALPHIEGDMCPVCERDYSESSPVPLAAHLNTRLNALSTRAAEIQRVIGERSTVRTNLTALRQRRSLLENRQLRQPDRVTIKGRLAELTEVEQELHRMRPAVEQGEQLRAAAAKAARALAELRSQWTTRTEIRARLAEMASALGEQVPSESETTDALVGRITERVAREEERLANLQKERRRALAAHRELQTTRGRRDALAKKAPQLDADLGKARHALASAKQRIAGAKHLAELARAVRAAVVGRVFNETLNKIWRDLFVRLAPAEPFVPAFKVPDATARGPVVAQFETVHRDGLKGGAPSTMLSAGNLNTAALTLFLALHLSVEARLPCVLLDDPVQSMDEVHIAQFAALLRTFVRGHKRQVVLAVHERSLFEYLRLELSPAFSGERLLTIELSRTPTGESSAEASYHTWKPDVVASSAA